MVARFNHCVLWTADDVGPYDIKFVARENKREEQSSSPTKKEPPDWADFLLAGYEWVKGKALALKGIGTPRVALSFYFP